jgi:hypothetical protein
MIAAPGGSGVEVNAATLTPKSLTEKEVSDFRRL